MDELKTMRTFVKVVDEGSFAAAARALGVANSVVTRAVAELEGALGCRLLNRTTRALALTDAGARYVERVRSILEDIADANTQAAEATGKVRGLLRVAAPQEFLTASLGRLLPRLTVRHPELRVQLLLTHSQAAAPEDDADLSILVHGPQELDGQFVARLLAHSEAVLCATPEYLARPGLPPLRTPADLRAHTVLVPALAAARKTWTFVRQGADGRPQVETLEPQTTAISTDNAGVMVAAARGHFGVAAALSLNVADELRAGRLVRVLADWSIATYRVYAAMPSRAHLPLRTRACIDFLLEQYGGQAADPWLAGRPV